MKNEKVEMIYNVAYAPFLNPIELYFSALKTKFRGLKLQDLIRKTEAPT